MKTVVIYDTQVFLDPSTMDRDKYAALVVKGMTLLLDSIERDGAEMGKRIRIYLSIESENE